MTKLVVFEPFWAFSRFFSIRRHEWRHPRNTNAPGYGRGLMPSPEAVGGA